MHSTNFTNKNIEKINNLLEFTLNNEFSNFYNKKYDDIWLKKINDYWDFLKFPFLKKDEILETEINKRTFIPEDSIRFYSSSSGTTNNKRITIIPHADYGYPEHRTGWIKETLKIAWVKKCMILLGEASASFIWNLKHMQSLDIPTVLWNVKNLWVSSKIAKETNIDAIVTNPSILLRLIKELKNSWFDLDDIKWISLWWEYCSDLTNLYLKEIFKNAYFNFRYWNSEFIWNIWYRCKHLWNNSPQNIFHINPSAILEILDENWNISEENEFWEIVLTDLVIRALPLIRYRIWDVWRISKFECECWEKYILEFSWRSWNDFLKFHWLTLKTDMLYNSMSGTNWFLEHRYEAHVYEKNIDWNILPQLIIKAQFRENYRDLKNDTVFIDALLKDISSKLYLWPNISLQNLVDDKNFLPLGIEFVENWENELKSLSIISHL